VRMAVIECPARFYGRARASLGRWVANPPAWLSVPFRLPGPKPFGCQQSNRLRMATQAKNVQTINNKSAKGLRSLRGWPWHRQNFTWQDIDVLASTPKNMHPVMAIENGSIWPRFQ